MRLSIVQHLLLPIPRRLQRKQLGVAPAPAQQLLVGANLHELAVFDDQDAVGHADGAEAVADEDGGFAQGQLLEALEDFVLGAGIEGGGGLVEDEELGVAHVSAAEGDFLPLAAAQIHAAVEAAANHLVVAAGQLGDDAVGQALVGGGFDAGLVQALLDAAHGQVLAGRQLEAHEILEDDADFLAQLGGVVFAQIVAVEQDAALAGVVEAGQELDEGGFAGAVFAHQRQLLAGVQREAEVANGPLRPILVLKPDVLKLEPLPDGPREGPRRLAAGHLPHDAGPQGKEVEEVLQVQGPVGHRAEAAEDAFEQRPQPGKRAGQEGELAQRNLPGHGAGDDVDVGPVVARRAHGGEQRAPAGAAQHQAFVLAVKVVGQLAEAGDEEAGEAKNLHFLGRFVAGPGLAQVVELAALGRPGVREGVAALVEVRLAQEGGHHGQQQQPQQPRLEGHQPAGQQHERHGVLALGQHLAHEHGAREGLAAGALQLVVEGAVLELVEVELGRVLHEADGGLVGEQVAEQRIEQGHAAAQGIGQQHQAEFEAHQREHGRELAGRRGQPGEAHHGINNELAHIKRGQRQKRPQQPQRHVGCRQSRAGAPDEFQEGGQVAQGRHPLAHAHGGLFGAARGVGVAGGDGLQEVEHCRGRGKLGAGVGGAAVLAGGYR